MEEPVHGILGRDDELARVKDFLGSVPERPSALRLEGTAGIGKTTLWHAGVAFARALGHRVLSCRAAESEARLSYAALGDLFDFELPDLPAPQKRALDAALLRAEVEGAPPDQRAVSVASLGALRALAASGPVIIAIDDVQWLDAPSARVLAFVVQQELTVYERLGRYVVRDELLAYLAEVECRAGNWDVAARHAQEAYEIDIESGRVLGQGHTLFPKALVAAHQGDMDRARSDAEEGLRQCLRNQDTLDVSCHRAVLGFLELSLRNPAAAIERLEPVLAFLDELGSPEPGIIPCVPDAIEALVSLGRLNEAEELVDRLERQGRTQDRPWAIATAARARGLLAAARGDLPAARAALEQALLEHRRVPQPFELARTLLVKGEVERRAKQKRAARSALEQALAIFQTLGAPLWAQRARDDLARVGGPVPPSGELTPTEQRIAELVGEGKKNREVADALFISVKTVEANLSRIFHKLGVRSRTELTRRITSTRAGT